MDRWGPVIKEAKITINESNVMDVARLQERMP